MEEKLVNDETYLTCLSNISIYLSNEKIKKII